MSTLSDKTAISFWKSAHRDIGWNPNSVINVERFQLMNNVINWTFQLFGEPIAHFYVEPTGLSDASAGKRSISGAGTYEAATRKMTFSGSNMAFTSADIEKPLMVYMNNKAYTGFVESVVSGTAVIIRNSNLPTADAVVDAFMIASSNPNDNIISLAQLRLNKLGQQFRIQIQSSVTSHVDAVDFDTFNTAIMSASKNRDRILYTVSGNEILLKKGDKLSAFGIYEVRYPRLPYVLVADTDLVDLPDGLVMQIGHTALRINLARRRGRPDLVNSYLSELDSGIGKFNRSYGTEIAKADVQNKIKELT